MAYNPAQQFIATSYGYSLSSTTLKFSYRFTAQKSGTVSSIKIYIYGKWGAVPTYRAGMQANSSGNPSGSWLGSGTFTPTIANWWTILLDSPVSVTVGTIYHIVIQYESGTPIDLSNYAGIVATIKSSIVPLNQVTDSNQEFIYYNGSTWSTQTKSPVYILVFDDTSIEGQPYNTYYNLAIYGSRYIAQTHTMDENVTVDQFGVYVKKSSTNIPDDDLYYEIRDNLNSILRNGTLVAKDTITSSVAWYDVALSSPIQLNNNDKYRFVLNSPLSDNVDYYIWCAPIP